MQQLHVEVGVFGGDSEQVTKSTGRTVNPIWSSTITMCDLQPIVERQQVVLGDHHDVRPATDGTAAGGAQGHRHA